MVDILQVEENIYRIDTGVKVPHPVFVYVIVDRGLSLVDPGPPVAVSIVLEALRQLGYEPASLSRLLLTHVHMDHAGGAGHLAQQLPQLEIVVHPKGAPHLVDPTRLVAGTKGVFGDDFEQEFGCILPVPEQQIYLAQDEELISLGERELRVVYSPGHATHHMCFYDTEEGGLFCGEAMGTPLPGTDFVLPSVAPPKFDLGLYLETLAKLRNLSPSILLYPHNGISREAERQFQLAYEGVEICRSVLTEAARAGESPEQIAERFSAYIPKTVILKFEPFFRSLLAEGINYFKIGPS